jgi:16S rRNA G966 N2-methylase RsmD
VGTDIFRYFGSAAMPAADDAPTVIFLDPPYRFLRERASELGALGGELGRRLGAEGLMVFRHEAGDGLELPRLTLADERKYGGMIVKFYRRGSGA